MLAIQAMEILGRIVPNMAVERSKQMNRALLSSKTDLWETPQDFFDELDREFHFDLDVCALPENAKCKKYYSPKDNGLTQPWQGTVWCNPPYGRQIVKWVERAHYFTSLGYADTVVMLLPARTDTRWFHQYILGNEIRFIKGRLTFELSGNRLNPAPFPSMVVIFRGKPVNSKGGQAC